MNGKIIRVNMSDLAISVEELAREYYGLAGRGLASSIVAREVPARCHPLSAHAKVVLAPGILAGTSVPSSGCLWIACKSPLTGGIKDVDVGGTAGTGVGKLGIRAIVVEGCAQGGHTYILHITKDGAVLLSNGHFRGIGNYTFVKHMAGRFGAMVSIVSIGPAGEMKLSSATIAVTDMQTGRAWHAGGCGAGSVMGSKGLKGIIIVDAGTPSVEPVDHEGFRRGKGALARALAERSATGCAQNNLGTTQAVKATNANGFHSARNHCLGKLEDVQTIPCESLSRILMSAPGWKAGNSCMPGCAIKCSNVYLNEIGQRVTFGLEPETIRTYGAGCGISDLDAIARLDRLCDDYGLDIVEAGVAIAVAMEVGLEKYGDAQAAIGLIQEIGDGTPLGRILGHGAEFTSKAFGVIRVAPIKGQGMGEYDERACKPTDVTFATAPLEAEDTAGWPDGSNSAGDTAAISPETGQAELNEKAQVVTAVLDCTGLCKFVSSVVADSRGGLEAILNMYNSCLGANLTVDSFLEIGKEVLEVEGDFNIRAGLGLSDDPPPQ